jgi:hypothetical protein
MMNTILIRHGRQQREFRLTKGGYDFDGKRITISIETWAEDGEAPYAANFSLVNHPVAGGVLAPGAHFSFKDEHGEGWDDENTHANAYFDFHAESVRLDFKIVAFDMSSLTVELSALTEDYGYDEDGTPNLMVGKFQLPRLPRHELWIPT